jgi:hypothetical protein
MRILFLLEKGNHIWNFKIPNFKLELEEFHGEIVDVGCSAHIVVCRCPAN